MIVRRDQNAGYAGKGGFQILHHCVLLRKCLFALAADARRKHERQNHDGEDQKRKAERLRNENRRIALADRIARRKFSSSIGPRMKPRSNGAGSNRILLSAKPMTLKPAMTNTSKTCC